MTKARRRKPGARADLKLNPHIHAVFLDGVFREKGATGEELEFRELARLSTREVAGVLERTRDRMTKYLRRRGLLEQDEEGDAQEHDVLAGLAASAASGVTPPAGPEWRRGALPLTHRPMAFERPLSVALDGFTLHAATRAGGLDDEGREALLKYILRPAVAQERVTRGPHGLVRIALKKAFSDGTVAVDRDPLSLLGRLAASVPAPRFHTVRYAGVLAEASKLRARDRTHPRDAPRSEDGMDAREPWRRGRYRRRPSSWSGPSVLTSSPVPDGRAACVCSRWSPSPIASRAISAGSVSPPTRHREHPPAVPPSGRLTSSEGRPPASTPPSNEHAPLEGEPASAHPDPHAPAPRKLDTTALRTHPPACTRFPRRPQPPRYIA